MRNNKETNGESWYYSINDDLTIGRLTGKFGKFDVRTRDWYQKAQTTRSVVFSDLYYHFARPAFTVSVSKSILTKTEIFWVCWASTLFFQTLIIFDGNGQRQEGICFHS